MGKAIQVDLFPSASVAGGASSEGKYQDLFSYKEEITRLIEGAQKSAAVYIKIADLAGAETVDYFIYEEVPIMGGDHQLATANIAANGTTKVAISGPLSGRLKIKFTANNGAVTCAASAIATDS